MRHAKRWCAVLADSAGEHLSLFHDRIDVVNIPRDKFLKYELRRMIAPVVAIIEVRQHLPDLFLRLTFPDPECRNFISRFYDQRPGNAFEKTLDILMIENAGEFGTRDPRLVCDVSH